MSLKPNGAVETLLGSSKNPDGLFSPEDHLFIVTKGQDACSLFILYANPFLDHMLFKEKEKEKSLFNP